MHSPNLQLLRIYTDVLAAREGQPYWKILINRARSMVGKCSRPKSSTDLGQPLWCTGAKALALAPSTHVIVEVSDTESALRDLHDTLEVSDDTGLVTLEAVGVVGYGGHRHPSSVLSR